jgi:outer membrane protein TolC
MASAPLAHALQPLEEFVSGAKSANLDMREARANADQRLQEARAAWARVGPTFTAKATYTRNQRATTLCLPSGLGQPMCPPQTPVTITPIDQADGLFSLNLPIIDVASWQRVGSAGATADAARVRADATGVDVEKSVVRAYLSVVANEATLDAAQRALATARESQAIVGTRRTSGSASDLDVERARAEVERAKQVVASAEEARAVSRRSLETLTGITPSDGSVPIPENSLGEEPDLGSLEHDVAKLPAVRAAALDTRAAEKTESAAWWSAAAPTVSANATERLTNAVGFGQPANWALAVSATWTLDPSTYFTAKAQSSARAAAEVRQRRAEKQARDALHGSWQDVRAGVARARAARAEADASARAAKLARDRYQAGAATQLDVQQAERDWFNSEVARIGAEADLAYARAAVRLDSGRAR